MKLNSSLSEPEFTEFIVPLIETACSVINNINNELVCS